jgi:hypothetical protein
MLVTKLAVEPLLSFITKVTAARVAGQQAPGGPKPLREQVGGRAAGALCTSSRRPFRLRSPLAAAGGC